MRPFVAMLDPGSERVGRQAVLVQLSGRHSPETERRMSETTFWERMRVLKWIHKEIEDVEELISRTTLEESSAARGSPRSDERQPTWLAGRKKMCTAADLCIAIP